MNLLAIAAVAAAIAWLTVLALPWQPWRTRESLSPQPDNAPLDDIVVLIPARNEAQLIAATLGAVAAQGPGIRAVVVDDGSSDGTAECARAAGDFVEVVTAAPPEPGWSGKLWALEQGRRRLDRPLTLLLDADIELTPGMVAALRTKLLDEDRALVSIMARLPAQGFWEALLLPTFVYFFRLLYPFALVNDPRWPFGAAAGGCILIRTETITTLDLFRAIRGRLIDDCALGHAVKRAGGAIWLGLSRGVTSRRPAGGFVGVADMVARNAYTQLRCSAWLLLGCTVAMTVLFVAPPVALVSGAAPVSGLVALSVMAATLVPLLRYYRMSPAWSLLMPLAGLCYLGMTWLSAARYWRGRQSQWKGRRYTPGFDR